MKIWNISIWTSAREAAEYGCTNHARFMGIVPGFCGEVDGQMMWVPRSDLLNWLEDVLSTIGAMVNEYAGRDPVFSFAVGKQI